MAVKGKKAGKAAKGAQKPKKAPKAKKPRQARLPGTEDNKIQEIETAALDYIDARDNRMELTKVETAAKDTLLGAMHRQQKTHYRNGEIEVSIVPEGEKLKVKKISLASSDEPEDELGEEDLPESPED